MSRSVIQYDKILPAIADRRPWEAPESYLVKDESAPNGWREETSGRRPSNLLLVPKLREKIAAWRQGGYDGASEVTRRLFEFWFEEDHEVPGFGVPFRYYFCQREAIETLAWLVEIAKERDAKALVEAYGHIFQRDLLSKNIEFETTTEGKRQMRRYVPELEAVGVQELPPEYLRRFAFKMATGSGKTWVMAMTVVWARFHKLRVPDSPLSTNFLVVAPNVIVYQRLEKDFASNRIFNEIPLIPPEWKGAFSQKIILRGDAADPDPSGNLFLTNIQQLYEFRDEEWNPGNAVETLLGRKPSKDLAASGQRSMLERLKSLKDLVVINDEAHHVHEEDLAWNQSLLAIHRSLPRGLSAWLDFSATPKDQSGMYFPWTVVDYPLAQAVEDRIVKAPIIVDKDADSKNPKPEPDKVSKTDIAEKYGFWIRAAVHRWQEHWKIYKKLSMKPVLFVVTEKNAYADALGKYLWKTGEFGFKESEILVIHTNKDGEITKKDLDKARQAARDIDNPKSKIKAIVSVMMLREGWDVRNVTVVLGLRPFTAKAEILPEQVIGRGLRLMTGIGPDRTQTLEVVGTPKLLDVLRNQLELEGVAAPKTKNGPEPPVVIEAIQEKIGYDISIPITKPSLVREIRKLSELDVSSLKPIYDQEELDEVIRNNLKLEFGTTETEIHSDHFEPDRLPSAQENLSSITSKVIGRAKLTNCFAELYPKVKQYVATRCFGASIDLDAENIRAHLAKLPLREGIAKYLAHKIGKLTAERRPIEFDNAEHRLSATKPFTWRRNLPPLSATKTIFNYVATYNGFERAFAEFLDAAPDVLRFAALGTTEQGESGSPFRIDYLKPSGAIGFYYPDWVAVQRTSEGAEVNWIIETKGRVWEGTKEKDDAMTEWCRRVTATTTGTSWRYVRVNQKEFELGKSKTLAEAVKKATLPGIE